TAKTYNNLGSALAGLERHRESVAAYRRALALKPDFFQAHCNIGRSLAVIDEHEEAIEHYRQALAIKSDLETAYAGLGNSLAPLRARARRPRPAVWRAGHPPPPRPTCTPASDTPWRRSAGWRRRGSRSRRRSRWRRTAPIFIAGSPRRNGSPPATRISRRWRN